ncbi:MAG TPA: hypothetical protein PLF13_11650 [candidate division Zixibacteria bacterium]|nr:hypothetical protein [candidate division Zixibacteria bacterium]
MKYLDYSVMPDILHRFFPDNASRLVGPGYKVDSGYYDIIRFFNSGHHPDEIKINCLESQFHFRDDLIDRFARRTADGMKAEGRLFDGPPAMHLVKADFTSPQSCLTVCRCDYGLQAGSCFALDMPDELFIDKGGSLREYYLRIGTDRTGYSPLPACLGVCGLLLNRWENRYSLWVAHRSPQLASLEDSIGPSAAGSVDYSITNATLDRLAHSAMVTEISEELGLNKNEYRLTLLAFAREIFRGEKPQLFFLIETNQPEPDLFHLLKEAAIHSGEAESMHRMDCDRYGNVTPEDLVCLNHEAAANLHLIREYLNNR